jgi:hypothetical protein
VNKLVKKLRPEESPLIVARDFLIGKGTPPPVITDEWWLDVVELQETHHSPDPNEGVSNWLFPLPFQSGAQGRERGLNIAWTALQMDWSFDGHDRKICQLTSPDRVHEFLTMWPGLLERARANPSLLALYAPQLTIPGFDNGLIDIFDDLLDPSVEEAYAPPMYSNSKTSDGKPALCGELIAWRHPAIGNYADTSLAYSFVHASAHHYSRYSFSAFKCLIWLLSSDANWMPARLHAALLEGMKKSALWFNDVVREDNSFSLGLLTLNRSKFSFTREKRSALDKLLAATLQELNSSANPSLIASSFIDCRFVEGFYDLQDRRREKGKQRSKEPRA